MTFLRKIFVSNLTFEWSVTFMDYSNMIFQVVSIQKSFLEDSHLNPLFPLWIEAMRFFRSHFWEKILPQG